MAHFLVLGAGGFIGRRLVRRLAADGHDVGAPARDAPWPEGEVGHVVYCAGLTGDFPQRQVDTAVAHVGRLAEFLSTARPMSLTYLSSTRLYDMADGVAREDDPIRLEPRRRRHLYHLTKAAGEALVLSGVCRNGRVARLSCVYSDDLDDDSYFHDLVRRAVDVPSLSVTGAPGTARDYVHIDDVCTALRRIALDGRRPIYNVASGENTANRDIFAWLEDGAGCHVNACGDDVGDVPPIIDVGALKTDFDLVPRRLADALPAILAARRAASTLAASA